jgi:putative PIN family toxin of toxin-antitoxin system
MNVVFDANVLIPLMLDVSRSTRLFFRLKADGHSIVASPAILEEVASKLRTKQSLRKWLDASDEQVGRFLLELPTLLRMVPGIVTIGGAVPGDPDDDAIISAAIESGSEYIVTEDKHLLVLGSWHRIEIMNREQFDRELDRLGIPTLKRP